MRLMADDLVDVFGGVDTHRDVDVAAVVDTAGWVLASAPFRADACRALILPFEQRKVPLRPVVVAKDISGKVATLPSL